MNESSSSRSSSPGSGRAGAELGGLQALLEEAPYIDDAGFSKRVLLALPRRRRSRLLAFRVVPAFAALGCVLAYALSGRPLSSQGASLSLSVVTTWSFFAAAVALLLVASATLLAADE
jgi:hypothetical protein